MVFKPSATLKPRAPARPGSGETAFRIFLMIAVAGCLWTTLLQPRLPVLESWLKGLLG